MHFPSFPPFLAAAKSLRASSPSVRLVLRYGTRNGRALLAVKVTDDATTLTFRTDSRADLRDIDALALYLLDHDVRADGVSPAALAAATAPAAARAHAAGSGAQRRAAARERAAARGEAPRPSKLARATARRAEARAARRRLRAEAGFVRG
jgi:hypothetical protein